MARPGKVYLIGAGPGDPGLITVKGLRCLAEAEVVVYDRLVDESLLKKAKPGAEVIYAGKAARGHTLSQEEINHLLVSKAREGKVVARLKGGDPFVFGRGGEEAEALASAGIPFEVVPGVTSAVAVPAYAGIPVTHRHLTSTFAIVTGHEEPGKAESSIAWEKLAGLGTLVFLMGRENLAYIARMLVKHGRSPQTPAAAIRWGTLPRQETVVGTLADIADKAEAAGLRPPVVVVTGEVVSLRETLRWFDRKPLFGKRVLVTRSRSQASALSELLAQEGAEPLELPTIEIQAPSDGYRALDAALEKIGSFSWALFTSANGVEAFFQRLSACGRDARALAPVKVGAIGPATAEALKQRGVQPDLLPSDYSTGGLLEALGQIPLEGERFLLPRAEEVPEELARGLRERGAEVIEVAAYRTISSPPPPDVMERLRRGEIDIVTFTSSSTVKNLADLLGPDLEILRQKVVACIGPQTERTARELGLPVQVVAREHSIPGLVEALKERFGGGK